MAKKPKLGEGGRFEKLEHTVAEDQEAKGIPAGKAKAIGAAVAAKAGIKKYGQAKMTAMAVKGRFTPKTKGEKNAAKYL